eukprot:GHUV01020524.1.p1 GENE.GHUV01020524.1~~GHUV01020524.1.p1  ORF type:complete len:132 (-),score=23.69 GHUV01020524.1:1262-1657(-)
MIRVGGAVQLVLVTLGLVGHTNNTQCVLGVTAAVKIMRVQLLLRTSSWYNTATGDAMAQVMTAIMAALRHAAAACIQRLGLKKLMSIGYNCCHAILPCCTACISYQRHVECGCAPSSDLPTRQLVHCRTSP